MAEGLKKRKKINTKDKIREPRAIRAKEINDNEGGTNDAEGLLFKLRRRR